MVFCAKDTACQKNGKVKKGFREVKCKNGSVKYMTDSTTKKKPILNPGSKKKAPVKPRVKKVTINPETEETDI